MLAKLNWRLNTEREAPWAKVLQAKYCNNRRLNAANADKLPCSRIWKAIKKGREVFTQGSMWIAGRDSMLSFWHGKWMKQGPLRHLIQGPLTRGASNWAVKDIMVDSGIDWSCVPFVFPPEIKHVLQATPLSLTGRSGDKLVWAANPKGSFDLKSAYNLAMVREEDDPFTASWIWKAPTLPRIKSFLWQCIHNSIAVKECLTRRGVVEDGTCPICNREVESILHALRDCPRVHLVWRQIGVQMSNHGFWNSNLTNWLNLNGRLNISQPAGKPPRKILFPFAVWSIWKYRNDFVFNRKMQNLNLVADIHNKAMEFLHCVYHPRDLPRHIIKRVCWEKPPSGWAKLNTDGAAVGSSGLAGCGGLIRDENGAWVAGFSRNIGSTTSFAVELWGIRDGLALCYNLNIHSIIVELDAKSIVDVFGNPNCEGNVISPILDDCKQLMMQFHQIQFKHCYREANRCADMLAKVGLDQISCLMHFDCPPEIIRTVLDEDCNGVFVDRICSVLDVVS